MFHNAHRLFGVSNILKILNQLNPYQKTEAMRSIVFQSDIRKRFPVYGCMGVIYQLNYQIRQTEEELHAINTHLAICRQQHQHQILSTPPHHSPSSQLQLGMVPTNNTLPLLHNHPSQPYNVAATVMSIAPHHYLSNGNNAPYNTISYIDSKDNLANPSWIQHSYNSNNDNQLAIQSQLVSSHTLPIQQTIEVPQDYDEIPPFLDTIDDRQSYIDSKEACESRHTSFS
ncbi:hypothetical protein HHK36_024821 [Tetracentron sinense]|uniref:LOB domain-containing protein n=1 Tax=Tetracentron sinense TaxID=13715 RepID=A0A834YNT2_TETSI|nr:hypothetical protein HHK36_024821 [Tetracentron sinense]